MFRVLGSPKKLCDGVTRRDLLQIGGASLAGLSLPHLLSQNVQAHSELRPGFGKAKNCIVLFLYGSPSQLETFDMKPDAPAEVKGTIKPIASSLPGLDVSELLPNMARVMDRCSVIRSCTHPYPIHGVAYAMTGTGFVDVGMELNPRDERHHPYFGSCVEYVDRQRRGGQPHEFVQNVALPFPFSSKRTDQPFRAGPYGAFLEGSFQPVWTEFFGQGTVNVRKARTGFSYDGPEPYLGCSRDSHFRLAAVDSNPDVTLDRLNRRKSLLLQFDDSRRELDRSLPGQSLSKFQQMAYSIVASPKVRDALDVRHESDAIRDRYGMTLFGQSCLAARRMVEAGTRLVSVFWDEYGLAGDAWDTHTDHFPRMYDQLSPGLDKAFAGLILDLEERGLLDDTLVVLVSEHGRTPKIANIPGGGRDHWSQAYSTVFAGGGTPRGRIIGATDKIAGQVTDRPISPKSMLATMYHLLGIDPFLTHLKNREGQEVPLVPETAEIIPELIA